MIDWFESWQRALDKLVEESAKFYSEKEKVRSLSFELNISKQETEKLREKNSVLQQRLDTAKESETRYFNTSVLYAGMLSARSERR